jgi:hypothetical protein
VTFEKLAALMTYDSLYAAIFAQDLWLQLWVGWLVVVNVLGGFFFIRRPEAKWVLFAMLGNAVFMSWLFDVYGFQRILGLAHVVFWTPLLVYLWGRRDRWAVSSLSGKWLAALFTTNAISLVIDYIDVARYLGGERL